MAATSYSTDPALYIFTSLTAGSSHIVTATSRLETILRANRVPFKAVDIAVDEKARMLWGRRAGKDEGGRVRKLPGLVQEGLVLGDLVEIEDWNEYGELKQHVKIYYDEHTIPNIHNKPKDPPKRVKQPVPAGAKAGTAGQSAAGTGGQPPAPPAAPPLPKTDSSSSTGKKVGDGDAATTTANKEEASKKSSVVEKVAAPVRSVAEEAAAKAKSLRLQALREKVHGSKTGKPDEGGEKQAEETGSAAAATAEAEPKGRSASAPRSSVVSEMSTSSLPAPSGGGGGSGGATSVQSPTKGTWVSVTPSYDMLPIREMVQDPATAAWVSHETLEPPVKSHRGSMVAAASQEEIQALEQAEAIPEAEEESSDEEDDKGQKEGEDAAEEKKGTA